MKFSTIKEYLEYKPNCIICNKRMNISFRLYRNKFLESPKFPVILNCDSYATDDFVFLHCDNNYFQIDIKNNSFKDGNHYIASSHKSCFNCEYSQRFILEESKNCNSIILDDEMLTIDIFGKKVNICKSYQDILGLQNKFITYLSFDDCEEYIDCDVDFDKIHPLDRFKEKIKMALVFQ